MRLQSGVADSYSAPVESWTLLSSDLAALFGLCQDHNMKHLLLACLFPMTLTAQTMQQLTEQLGKTFLYGDVALSPDGTHVAWVQSTAASTSKQTNVREISGDASATLVKIPISSERTDFDPEWAPDSRTLAVFPAPMRESSANSGV